MKVQIQALHFNDLTARQLFQILKLRQDVFFVEEKIIYPDLDDTDEDCIHVFATTEKDGKTITVSYARVYFDPLEQHVKVGRVATAAAYRGQGIGGEVMRRCCEVAQSRFSDSEVWLDAQAPCRRFLQIIGLPGRLRCLHGGRHRAYQNDVEKMTHVNATNVSKV